jgi:integrase
MQYSIVKHRGKWAIRLADRSRLSTGLNATPNNRDVAEQKAREIIGALKAATSTGVIKELYQEYRDDAVERGVVSISRIDECWKNLKPMFGQLRPDEIDRKLCREYAKRRREKNISDGTILTELRKLRSAVRYNNPDIGVFEFPPEPEPRDRWLSKNDFNLLIDEARQTAHLVLFLEIAIATAARKEAILKLRWSREADGSGWIDFDKREIHMGRKSNGKKRATVPMNNQVFLILQQAKQCALSDHVIEYAGGSVGSIKNAFGKARSRVMEKHNLDHFTIHDIRHSSAVWLAAAGFPMSQISQYLGHTSTAITERVYARYAPEHLRDAADALEY